MLPSPECSQCGMMHPALSAGESCPNAPVETSSGKVVDFTPLFNSLKIIITSQIQSRKIKDHKKMFGAIVVEMTKFIENYKEGESPQKQ